MFENIKNLKDIKETKVSISNQDKLPIEGILSYIDNGKPTEPVKVKYFFKRLFSFKRKNIIINTKKEKKENIIIMLHGINSNPNTNMILSFRNHFTKKGFDFFRYSLYGSTTKNGKSRSMAHATVEMHINDLNHVLKHFNKKYKNIYLIGHSLGGFSVLMHNSPMVKTNILIDPPYILTLNMKLKYSLSNVLKVQKSPIKDSSIIDWGDGKPFFISNKIASTAKNLKKDTVELKVKELHSPTLMIKATNSWIDNSAFKKLLKSPHNYKTVNGANHSFTKIGNIDDLIKVSEKWIYKYCE